MTEYTIDLNEYGRTALPAKLLSPSIRSEHPKLLPLLQEAFRKAEHPLWRGRELKSRRVLCLGEQFYWKDDTPTIPLPKCFRDLGYNSGLINIYQGGAKITPHTDTSEGMNTEHDDGYILSMSYGLTEDLELCADGLDLGYMSVEDGNGKTIKYPLISGWGIKVKAYTYKHSAHTRRSKKFAYRVNITLRKQECDGI